MSAPRRNRAVALALVGVVAGMAGLAYAAVPLYSLFCQVTGYGGTTQRAEAPSGLRSEREVIVRFDGNIQGLDWDFRPAQPQMRVKLGETVTAYYIAESRSDRTTVGTAVFNVAPDASGIYFNKIECFCFAEQTLAAGERVQMPVQFFVSPDMLMDGDLSDTRAITLSYTMYPAGTDGQPVAQAPRDEAGKTM